MIICHCEVVTDRDVAAAVAAGARTTAQVCGATGAGRGCGTCVFSVKRLTCDHVASVESSQEVGSAAS